MMRCSQEINTSRVRSFTTKAASNTQVGKRAIIVIQAASTLYLLITLKVFMRGLSNIERQKNNSLIKSLTSCEGILSMDHLTRWRTKFVVNHTNKLFRRYRVIRNR